MDAGTRTVALAPTVAVLLPRPPDAVTAGSGFASFCYDQNCRLNRTRCKRSIELPALAGLERAVAEGTTALHDSNAGQRIHQHDALFGREHLMGDPERDGFARQRRNGLWITDRLLTGAEELSGRARFENEWRTVAFCDLNNGQAGSRSVKRAGLNEEHVADDGFNPAQHFRQPAVQRGASDLFGGSGPPETKLQP